MIACRIEPKGQIEPEGEGVWRSTGSDPQFRLTHPRGGRLFPFRLAGGWVRIRADLEGLGHTKPVPLLYVDDGSGFDAVWRGAVINAPVASFIVC